MLCCIQITHLIRQLKPIIIIILENVDFECKKEREQKLHFNDVVVWFGLVGDMTVCISRLITIKFNAKTVKGKTVCSYV